jgi:hypothetical protein
VVAPFSRRRHEQFVLDLQIDTQKQASQCTCNVILWRVRAMFIPPRIFQELIILLEGVVFIGRLTSPVTMKYSYVFSRSAKYFCITLIKFGFS